MKEKKVIYYRDELNEEFSNARIEPRVIDGSFAYFHGKLWNVCSFLAQNLFSMPIKLLYSRLKFRIRFVGVDKLRSCRKKGYFIYGNHTQPFADTFIPSLANYPKRNFFIVNPENVSIPGMRRLVELLGAIPIPCDLKGMKHFLASIEDKIRCNYSVTIYPEAHIWPYYTRIRPFKAVSFRYPVSFSCPVFALTNTYHARGKKGKVRIVTYIDGPFYPDEGLKPGERQKDLRDRVYQCMVERSTESDFEYIEYRKR
jgi:1-acyl-sn-glycerol-3-phosphate acyltransferase